MFKKFGNIIFFMFLVILLASSVAAADNGTVRSADLPQRDISEIQTAIDNAPEGSIVYLNNSYYSGSSTLTVDRKLIIDGSSMDGDGYSVIDKTAGGWHIETRADVTFVHINFTNFMNSATKRGGVLYAAAGEITVDDCSFINSRASIDGGAIYKATSVTNSRFVNCFTATNGGALYFSDLVVNCTFINCSSNARGGAIFEHESVINSTFINCSTVENGGAIYASVDYVKTVNCTFENCSANYGGAIYEPNSVSNCNFTGCSATTSGGAIYEPGDGAITDCNFNDCSAQYGGAISRPDSIIGCSFENCSATGDGGAIYAYGSGNVINCTLINCSADQRGSAIYVSNGSDSILVVNSTFDCANTDGIAVIYLSEAKGNFSNNRIVSDMIPIYLNEGAQIISPSTLSVLDGSDIYTGINKTVNVTAVLKDDGGNVVGSANDAVIKINGTDYGASFNPDIMAFETAFSSDRFGTFPTEGSFSDATDLAVDNGNIIVGNRSAVAVSMENATYGEAIRGNVSLMDVNGNSINGTVSVKINGKTVNVTVTDGKGNFTWDKLAAGNYTATVEFEGNDYYIQSEDTDNFTVFKIATEINLSVSNMTYGSPAVVNVTLDDANGNPLSGFANVTVGDVSYEVNVVDGKCSLTVNGLVAGDYVASAAFNGDGNYSSSDDAVTFTVSKIATVIALSVSNVTYGSPVVVNVSLSDVNGTPLSGIVNVAVGSKSFNVSVAESIGSLAIGDLDAGDYVASAAFNGDNNHFSSDDSVTFTVSKIATVIALSVSNVTYGSPVVVNVSLSDANGTPLSGIVNVAVGSGSFDVAVAEGIGSLAIGDLDAGDYVASAAFNGDNNHFSSDGSVTFTVSKMATEISLSVSNVTYNSPVAVNVTLTDADGNPLSGKVNVTVNTLRRSNSVYEVDVADGKGSLTVDNLIPGDYMAFASFAGDENHEGSENETSFNVAKAIAQINATATVINDTVEIAIKTHENINGNVTVNIDGKNYIVDLENGVGKLALSNVPVGFHNGTVVFPGNENYTSEELEFNFTIEKKPDVDVDNATNITQMGRNVEITPDKIKNTEIVEKTGNPIALLLLMLIAIPVRRIFRK